MYYVYMVECADHSLYTGISTDPRRRTAVHNRGKGARYTRSRLPVSLVYSRAVADKSSALRQEYALKQLPRREKLLLIQSPENLVANSAENPNKNGERS